MFLKSTSYHTFIIGGWNFISMEFVGIGLASPSREKQCYRYDITNLLNKVGFGSVHYLDIILKPLAQTPWKLYEVKNFLPLSKVKYGHNINQSHNIVSNMQDQGWSWILISFKHDFCYLYSAENLNRDFEEKVVEHWLRKACRHVKFHKLSYKTSRTCSFQHVGLKLMN